MDTSIFDWLGHGAVKPIAIDIDSDSPNQPIDIDSDPSHTDLESGPDEGPYTPRALSSIPKAELVMIMAGVRDQARRNQLATLRAKFARPRHEACMHDAFLARVPCIVYSSRYPRFSAVPPI